MKRTLFVSLVLATSLIPQEILIKNATVYTVSRAGTIQKGSVLIRDGKIAAVGKDLKASSNAQVIDGEGLFLTPGIIDAHSHLAVEGGVNESSLSVSSIARIQDVINPDDKDIYRNLAGGLTIANVLHGSANAIGGQTQVIKLRYGAPAKDLNFKGAPTGIKFALGENPKRSNVTLQPGQARRYPATRMGVMDVIRQAFTDAKEYQADWDNYRKGKTKVAPIRNLTLEPLVEILEGKRLVHAHSYREDEIVALLRTAEEFGFKIATLQHILEGYKVAPEIQKHGAGASSFSDWWGYKVEAYDAIPHNASLMHQAGILVSINSDSNSEARHLNQEAAKSMKYGNTSYDDALAMVTINPAKQLGIDKMVGSIEVGKDADLVLYNRDPLSVYAVPQKVLIDGKMYFDIAMDTQMNESKSKEKDELTTKLKPKVDLNRPNPMGARPNPRIGSDFFDTFGQEWKEDLFCHIHSEYHTHD